jgi:hypothetical protein
MKCLLDNPATLSPQCGRAAGPVTEVEGGHCLRLIAIGVIAAFISIINISPSKADMNLKLYAYNKMDWSEFQCYNWLIFKESSWNPKARNGSHYGLGQMRSTWYRDLSPKKQIDAHIKYLRHRYPSGGACEALTHLETRGWH